MLTEKITYVDYNGLERTETYYFNLTKAEIAEMELSKEGGLTEYMQKLVDSKDAGTILDIFKKILLKSYGIKSEDGRRFIKSDEISKEFSETPAYSELYMRLAFDGKAAAEFIRGIVPEDVRRKMDEQRNKE